jgi:5-methyltetrahydrofolate--homocysteine methyltransferase
MKTENHYRLSDFKKQSQKTKVQIALSDFLLLQRQVKGLYGCFCVTTGFGVDEWAAEFEKI